MANGACEMLNPDEIGIRVKLEEIVVHSWIHQLGITKASTISYGTIILTVVIGVAKLVRGDVIDIAKKLLVNIKCRDKLSRGIQMYSIRIVIGPT